MRVVIAELLLHLLKIGRAFILNCNVGTAAVTSRGFKEEEMKLIAKWIKLAITDFENSKEVDNEEETEQSAETLLEEYNKEDSSENSED